MAEDLKRVNSQFKKLVEKLKDKIPKGMLKEGEALLYIFYLAGFNEGSGMTQLIQ